MQTSRKAAIKWAQSKDRVFITVEPADLTNHKVELKPEGRLIYRYEFWKDNEFLAESRVPRPTL